MNEQEAWVRIYCAALQAHVVGPEQGFARPQDAAWAADEGLLEFRKRAKRIAAPIDAYGTRPIIKIPEETR